MKELYEIPEFKISIFNIEDIVTASGDTGEISTEDPEGGDFDND